MKKSHDSSELIMAVIRFFRVKGFSGWLWPEAGLCLERDLEAGEVM